MKGDCLLSNCFLMNARVSPFSGSALNFQMTVALLDVERLIPMPLHVIERSVFSESCEVSRLGCED